MNDKLWMIIIIISICMVFGSMPYGAITDDFLGVAILIFVGLTIFTLCCALASDDAGAN